MYTLHPRWKSWIKCHLFPQAASVHGQRQWKWWTISHHLRLWDHVYSRLQIFIPGGEAELFSYTCFRMHAYLEVKLDSSMNIYIYIYDVSIFLCRVTINGIMTWWSSGQAATGNSRTPTWSRVTAPPASPGHFNGQRKLAWWDTITHAEYHL